MTVTDRQTILPLLLGAIASVLLHLGAGAAYVRWIDSTPPDASMADRTPHPPPRPPEPAQPDWQPRSEPVEPETDVPDAAPPDLVAEAMRIDRPAHANRSTPVHIALSNRCGSQAGPFAVTVLVSGQPVGEHRFASGLPAHRGGALTIPIVVEAPGHQEVAVVIDAGDQVAESNESNNRLSEVVQFRAPDSSQPPVGQLEPSRQVTIDWVSHQAFEQLKAKKVFESAQPAVQRNVEPRPVQATPMAPSETAAPRRRVEPGEQPNPPREPRPDPATAQRPDRTVPDPPEPNAPPPPEETTPSAQPADLKRDSETATGRPDGLRKTGGNAVEPADTQTASTAPNERASETASQSPEAKPASPESPVEARRDAPTEVDLPNEADEPASQRDAQQPEPVRLKPVNDGERPSPITSRESDSTDPALEAPPIQDVAPRVARTNPPVSLDDDGRTVALTTLPDLPSSTEPRRVGPRATNRNEVDPPDASAEIALTTIPQEPPEQLPAIPGETVNPPVRAGSTGRAEQAESNAPNDTESDGADAARLHPADRRVEQSNPATDAAANAKPDQPEPVESSEPRRRTEKVAQTEQPHRSERRERTEQRTEATRRAGAQPSEARTPTVAQRAESEAQPVARVEAAAIEPGGVVTVQGVKIRTALPRFSTVARMTSIPRNPIFDVVFDPSGKVVEVRMVRSTTYSNVDAPLRASLYRWEATGPIDPERGLTLERLRIVLRDQLRADEAEHEDEPDRETEAESEASE